LLVALGAALPFLGALDAGFVNWDDDLLLLENDRYHSLSAENLAWMFGEAYAGHYQPLTWLSYAFDYALWGAEPLGFHFTSILIHAINAVLFWLLLGELARHAVGEQFAGRRSTVWLCALGALLFAAHPLRVESVVWVTERRDLVSGLFWILTVLLYLRAHRGDKRRRGLILAHVAYLLCLLGKASGMTLPVVLLLLDVWPLRRRARGTSWPRLVAEKLPMFVMAALFALITLAAQGEAGARVDWDSHGLLPRLVQCCYGLCFYVGHTLAPFGLSPLYPLERALDLGELRFVASVITVAVVVLAMFLGRRRYPGLVLAVAVYMVVVGPFLGLAQVGPQLVADRYSYLSCLAFPAAIALWAVGRRRPLPIALAMIGTVAVLAVATVRQTAVWHDSITLWEYVLEREPESFNAHLNYSRALAERGELDRALVENRRTVELQPREYKAWTRIGAAEYRGGNFAASLEAYRRAHELVPNKPDYLHGMAISAFELGQFEDCVRYCEQCHAVDPGWPHAWSVLGDALSRLGRQSEARAAYERAR